MKQEFICMTTDHFHKVMDFLFILRLKLLLPSNISANIVWLKDAKEDK